MHPYANLMKHDDVRHIFLEPSRQQVMKSEKHLGKSTKNEEVGLLLYAAYLGTYSYMYVWQYIYYSCLVPFHVPTTYSYLDIHSE